MTRLLFTLNCLFFVCHWATAQITIEPRFPKMTDTVTLTFDATKGNAALTNFSGEVYAHTGLITTQSQHGSDWKNVVSGWNDNSKAPKLTPIGNNKYQFRFVPKELYKITDTEEVRQFAFLFRSSDTRTVARTKQNGDMFYSVDRKPIGDFLNYEILNGAIQIRTSQGGLLHLQPFTDHIVRVTNFPKDTVATFDPSLSTTLKPQIGISIKVEDAEKLMIFTAGKVTIRVQKTPLRVEFWESGARMVSEADGYTESQLSKFPDPKVNFFCDPDEVLQGTGSRGLDLNRKGSKVDMYNTAVYGYSGKQNTLNVTIPFFTSSKGYGLYFDNHWAGSIDLGANNTEIIEYAVEGGLLPYFYIGGGSPAQVLNNYQLLTGKQPLPPRWALGYIQSKYGYETQAEAENIVQTLKENQFPIDALVLDLYWFGNPSTMGNLDWDYTRFPKPVQMMDDLKKKGVKTILITEPYYTTKSSNYQEGDQKAFFGMTDQNQTHIINNFWAGSAALLDMSKKKATDWLWESYENRKDEGVAGWWTDLGEPENHPEMNMQLGSSRKVHNVYNLLWEKMLFDKYKENYPRERLFNMPRSGYAGMQRFSTFPWSGDVRRSFEGLQVQVPIMLGMSMSGVGYMHSDLGGFTGDNNPNQELYTRWLQLGAFSPIMRVHGEGMRNEPTAFSSSTQQIVKQYSQLRYQLLPYNYTLAYQNSSQGLPLARPMDFYDAQNTSLQNLNDQYLWGENMLVAPVLVSGQRSRSVVFPSGKWFGFENPVQEVYNGGTSWTVAAPLERLPLFVKAGAFVPMTTQPIFTTEAYQADSLRILYFQDPSIKNSSYTLFNDNGTSSNTLADSLFQLVTFKGTNDKQIKINIEPRNGRLLNNSKAKQLYFEVKRTSNAPNSIKYDLQFLKRYYNLSEYEKATQNSWFFDETIQQILIHVAASMQLPSEIVFSDDINTPTTETTLLPPTIDLYSAAPNPSNSQTTLFFGLPESGDYQLTIFDLMGINKGTFELKNRTKGTNEYLLDTQNLAKGMYLIRLTDKKRTKGNSLKIVKQ